MSYRSPRYHEPVGDNVVGTVTELFAGVGGFRIALAQSGLKTVFSNQWEPSTKVQHASACYVHHFGQQNHSNEDITSLVRRHVNGGNNEIPWTDLIVGGFPCQDYSVAKSLNSSRGLEGKKGVLWWDIYKLIQANRPSYVFLENVDRLLKSPVAQRGRDFAVMLKTLGSLGYLIEWRDVNAADFGFAQRRKRVFIVATKLDVTSDLGFDPFQTISTRGILARSLPIRLLDTSVARVRLDSTPGNISESFGKDGVASPFRNAGVYVNGSAFTIPVEARRARKWKVLGDLIRTDLVDDSFWIDPSRFEEWEALKGAKRIERRHKGSGETYVYAEGAVGFPDSLSSPSRTILTGEGGTSASRFKHVIAVDGRLRRLTPLELERLNGFPDDWTAESSHGRIPDTKRAFLMGNALVVGLVAKVGKALAQELKASSTRRSEERLAS